MEISKPLRGTAHDQEASPSVSTTIYGSERFCSRCMEHVVPLFESRAPPPEDYEYLLRITTDSFENTCEMCRFLSSCCTSKDQAKPLVLWAVSALHNYYDEVYCYNMWPDKIQHCFLDERWWVLSQCCEALEYGCLVLDDESTGPENEGQCRARSLDPESIDFGILKEWLDTCDHHHTGPCNAGTTSLPHLFSVIDCKREQLSQLPSGEKFIALSYVWGPSPPEEATESEEDKAWNVLPRNIPLVIKDAMAVTIALGYQYLWVDRYCISTDSAQKHQQISEMDLVYCSAHATIIAESAQIPSDGLPGVSTRCRQRQPQITLDKGVLRHTLPHGGAVIGNSKWASRAWCYQEYCLSRRRLFFTQSQVIFECAKTQAHETMSTSQAYFLAEEARPWKSFFPACYFATEHSASTRHVWDSIYNYTGRAMSYESDALNAMLGLFKVFQSSPVPIYHFWGVPYRPWANRSDLIENPISSLCWYILGSWKRRRTFPSWSWLGWSGSVLSEFHDKQDTETDHDLRIGAETRDGNEVQGWPPELCTKNRLAPYLLLEGKTSQLKCSRQDEHRLWYLRAVDGGEWLVLSDEIGFYAGGNPMSPHCVLEGEISDGEKGHHDSLTAVLLGTDSGLIYLLVLERNRTLDNEKRIGCERIGYIKIHRFDVMAKIQWENRRLRVG